MDLRGSAAVSRGKFARNIVQGIEGNQGPYRLRGAENELFIIILSGTERVFIDGKQLKRGQAHDYIIDYNTSEITFTAKQLITKDKRIEVEFQYSDKNYARSLVQFSDQYKNGPLSLYFDVFSERDSKNQPLQQELNDEQKEILRQAGDSLDGAISPGIDSIGWVDGQILYALQDSTFFDPVWNDSAYADSIFVYSVDPEVAHYRLTFSRVGTGNGNYVLDQNLANGRVYTWVQPIGGVPQGDYEPVIQLITPKKREMLVVGGAYEFNPNTKAGFELAASNNDVNTFSNLDKENDVGYAARLDLETKKPLSKKGVSLIAGLQYEHLDKNFKEVERFRKVEFDRDWNIRNQALTGSQNLAGVTLGLQKSKLGVVSYNLQTFAVGKDYNAMRNNWSVVGQHQGLDVNYRGSLTSSNTNEGASNFLRHKTLATKKIKSIKLGYRDDFERNRFTTNDADTLSSNSYGFWEWETFITNSDSTANRYKVNYIQRKDQVGSGANLVQSTFGQAAGFNYDLLKNPRNKLKTTITYRSLEISDTNLTEQTPDETLLSRIEYTLKLWKGAVTSTSFFEIGSGLEARKEFSFIPVDVGSGLYTWNDYNGDGIRQLDEFEVAVFQDTANYIKIATPTDTYEKVYTNQFNQSFFLRPAAVWNSKKGIRKLLSKFSDQLALSIDRKTRREEGISRFNPFETTIADSNLFHINSNFRNTFYFNQSDPVFGADINYQDISNKNLLTNGFESRRNRFGGLRGRWNLTRQFTLQGELTEGEKSNNSNVFVTRNFLIAYRKIIPTISFQPNTRFRISLKYEINEKDNIYSPPPEAEGTITTGETSTNQTLGTEVRYNTVGKGSLLFNLNYIGIAYSGDVNSPVAFEMLEGLQPGNNGTWSLSYQRTLAKNLQLNLNYNGRTSEDSPVIHTGGVEVRAFF